MTESQLGLIHISLGTLSTSNQNQYYVGNRNLKESQLDDAYGLYETVGGVQRCNLEKCCCEEGNQSDQIGICFKGMDMTYNSKIREYDEMKYRS